MHRSTRDPQRPLLETHGMHPAAGLGSWACARGLHGQQRDTQGRRVQNGAMVATLWRGAEAASRRLNVEARLSCVGVGIQPDPVAAPEMLMTFHRAITGKKAIHELWIVLQAHGITGVAFYPESILGL